MTDLAVNLIPDPRFHSIGSTYWRASGGGGTISRIQTSLPDGTSGDVLAIDCGASLSYGAVAQDNLTIAAGDYVYSVWIKSNSARRVYLQAAHDPVANVNYGSLMVNVQAGKWTHQVINCQLPAGKLSIGYIYAQSSGQVVSVWHPTLCTKQDWEQLQQLGLDWFDPGQATTPLTPVTPVSVGVGPTPMSIGTITTGNADARLERSGAGYRLDITIPKGDKGEKGDPGGLTAEERKNIVQDVTSLVTLINPTYWSVTHLSAILHNKRTVTLNAHIIRQSAPFNDSRAWFVEQVFRLDDSIKCPQELHVPAISNANNSNGLCAYLTGNTCGLRKVIDATILPIDGWVEYSITYNLAK